MRWEEGKRSRLEERRDKESRSGGEMSSWGEYRKRKEEKRRREIRGDTKREEKSSFSWNMFKKCNARFSLSSKWKVSGKSCYAIFQILIFTQTGLCNLCTSSDKNMQLIFLVWSKSAKPGLFNTTGFGNLCTCHEAITQQIFLIWSKIARPGLFTLNKKV